MSRFFRLHTSAVIAFLTIIIFSGCEQSRVYDKNIAIGKEGWAYGERLTFEVNIIDTTETYFMFVNVRHTDEYPFNNLWVNLTTTSPDGTSKEEKFDVVLSDPEGKWMGNCVDGICYNTEMIKKVRFNKSGKYQISMEQDMRMNPVPYILDAGIRVEKVMHELQ